MDNFEEGFIGKKYIVDSKTIEAGNGTWNALDVTVSRILDGNKEKVGSYSRNYPSLGETFFPFVLNNKELALYSSQYMYTRVMELPSCRDLGGEDKDNIDYKDHFCPVEFYIPVYRKVTSPEEAIGKKLEIWLTGDECFDKEYDSKNILGPIQYCNFGFVAGCIWGDDSSWKIQFLDLSESDKGIVKRDKRFGYIELPHSMSLKNAIDMRTWEPEHPWIGVTHTSWRNYDTGEEG
ncbi:MAG: hypothetical protein ABIG37_02930 [Nanoarchaeota archaeon]|nr:hypothetical protein [Nanoarchaeota archaeon]